MCIILTVSDAENRELKDAYWPLPEDLKILHDTVIEYAVRIQTAAAARHETLAKPRLSHTALSALHRRGVILHRSIRSLCETGWTSTSPVLIRTLLDILVNCYAIVSVGDDAEYMAFKFMASYLIQAINDADTSEELRKHHREQLEKLQQQFEGEERKRVDEFVSNFKPRAYWYQPEYSAPGKIIQGAMPRLFALYRQFSGSVHGSFIGSVLFDDAPDEVSINPKEHPRRTRDAVVASSRLLLDISWARATFELGTDDTEYRRIVKTFILPQQAKREE